MSLESLNLGEALTRPFKSEEALNGLREINCNPLTHLQKAIQHQTTV